MRRIFFQWGCFFVFGLLQIPGHGGDDPGKAGVNGAKAEKLCDGDYQDFVAWAIHMGILQYLSAAEE